MFSKATRILRSLQNKPTEDTAELILVYKRSAVTSLRLSGSLLQSDSFTQDDRARGVSYLRIDAERVRSGESPASEAAGSFCGLQFECSAVVPESEPGDSIVVPDFLPLLAREGVLWDGLSSADIDGDVPRVYPLLELAHLGMLPTASEQAWRLHPEVADLHEAT